ncbi:Rv3654c family TadE-like protein [Mycolicibacterium sp. CH28]|uniref:Rv3654c family TadE-like protein n=1 Tax=Mycolicibacterium sp. CH28 TaxID=2512237 RepID=UPI001F41B2DD|nr:Rv3654c family TadE-like protein [Mycolicibacterium sp. CH28]
MLIAALVALTLLGVEIGSAVVARHRAQAAADLAALAAAIWLPRGVDVACREAAGVSSAMRAVVTGCVVEDLDVVVTVDVATGRLPGGRARAAARAGPVDP